MNKINTIYLTLSLTFLCAYPIMPSSTQTTENKEKITLMKLASAFILSRAIHTAAEIKVADYMTDGSQHISLLAQKTSTNEQALFRLLQLLASYSIFSHDKNDNFSLTPLAQQLISTNRNSLWSWITYHNEKNRWIAFGDMKYSIETGNPSFDHIFEKNYFDFLAENPLLAIQFDEGMHNISHEEDRHITLTYDFSSYSTIVDIGGGKGGLLGEIINNNPSCKGLLFDLPHVEQSAHNYLAQLNLNDQINFTTSMGFFNPIPRNADLYILKRILHDWNDDDCITILQNCFDAMHDNSRLLIIEGIITQPNIRDFNKDIDITMMILFGGKERTEKEWIYLLEKANLQLIDIHTLPSLLSIIEIQKKQKDIL